MSLKMLRRRWNEGKVIIPVLLSLVTQQFSKKKTEEKTLRTLVRYVDTYVFVFFTDWERILFFFRPYFSIAIPHHHSAQTDLSNFPLRRNEEITRPRRWWWPRIPIYVDGEEDMRRVKKSQRKK